MKILAIADVESKYFWDYFQKENVADIDLILSAGDLDADYLSFLVTMSHAPVLYVHGNHDDNYDQRPPEGCQCVDDLLLVHQGIRILGLGGSMRYSQSKYQYTESQMKWRIWKLYFSIWRHKGFDILLTHAPARGFHDGEDLPHRGFSAFHHLIQKYHPKYFIHGHVHKNYGRHFMQTDHLDDTKVINAYGYCIFDY